MFAEIMFEPHQKRDFYENIIKPDKRAYYSDIPQRDLVCMKKTIWKGICVCASLLTILRYKHLVTSYHECV